MQSLSWAQAMKTKTLRIAMILIVHLILAVQIYYLCFYLEEAIMGMDVMLYKHNYADQSSVIKYPELASYFRHSGYCATIVLIAGVAASYLAEKYGVFPVAIAELLVLIVVAMGITIIILSHIVSFIGVC